MSKIYAKVSYNVGTDWIGISTIQPLSGSRREIANGSCFAFRWSSITPVDTRLTEQEEPCYLT